MAELTATGLTIKTQAEIIDDLEAAERADISDRLDVSSSSPFGQHNAISSRGLRLLEEALAAIYLAIDPDSATGDALDRICAITGTTREAATATRSLVTVNVDAGTYAIGSLVAMVTGRPDQLFANVEAVTVASTSNADVYFDALDTGPIACPLDTLVISGAVVGWNSIVSNTEGALGLAIESDAALRIRREAEVTNPGSTSTSGIAADILRNVSAVLTAYVVENDTNATVDSIPAHSLEAVVYGPTTPTAADDQAVADQIFASKAGGIGTYGTTTKTVTDSEGQDHSISFTRPAVVPLTITIDVDVNSATYAGDAALALAIQTQAALTLIPGLDAAGSQIASWAHTVPGVLRVTSVTINAGGSFAVHSITSRQVGQILVADITITSTGATP